MKDPFSTPNVRYRLKLNFKRPKRNFHDYIFNKRLEISMWNEWLKIRHKFI